VSGIATTTPPATITPATIMVTPSSPSTVMVATTTCNQ
jgi:hypothetical protein